MASLLSTGKKKAKASRVFGEVVLNEVEGSLCYSPSPCTTKLPNADSSEINPIPTVLFENNDNIVESQKKNVSFQTDKENVSENNSSVNNHNDARLSIQSIREEERSRLRASARSPLRRDLVQKTQAAINSATTTVYESLLNGGSGKTELSSVYHSLNAGRKAKMKVVDERSTKTKIVRFKWDEDNTRAKSFYDKLEENRRQMLSVQRKLASAYFTEKAQKEESHRWQRINALDQESAFNSEVFRDHQEKLKRDNDRNRKKSMEARAKQRQNKQEGKAKLQAMKRQEEAAIFDVRYDLHRARNELAKEIAESRRKSFQFRAGDAKRIRQIRSQWSKDEMRQQHEDYELKREAEKDVEQHKKQVDAARRDSLRNRNLESKKIREEDKHRAEAMMQADHKSFELKWAGEKDVEAYRKAMLEERRKSLASRNKESARHANVMKELRTLAQEKEAESFMLKWDAENDAKEYIAKLAEERRKSLQFRAQEAKKHREYDDEQHRNAVAKALAEADLQSQCQKDMENYERECEENLRKSLQFRGKESTVQRLEEQVQRQKQQELDHKNFELESLARMDVQEYIKDCKTRRRKSLAFRAKEKRRHAKWRLMQQEKELEARQLTAHFQSLDAQHIALAKQQERARQAIDALRNAGCAIKGNPFGDLLNL